MARLGVGKSRGCRNCRRRKVKCDERQPGCERCEKAEQECEGYVREHRFVDENTRTEKHAKKRASRQSRTPPSVADSPRDIVLFTEPNSRLTVPDLNLRAFEDNIFISFMLSNLLSGIPVVTPWLNVHDEDESDTSAQLSIRALGTLFFGRVHHQKDITTRGYNLYGQALISLNQDLEHPEKQWSLSVVKSAIALELYEFVAFNSASGWIKHAGGVGRLLELRGPLQHQSPRERIVLEASRAVIALSYLVRRKRCYLESYAWKTVPWALEPEAKTSIMYLQDILCDLPGLMEDAEILQTPRKNSKVCMADLTRLSDRIFSTLKELYEWRVSWQQENPNSCWEVLSIDVSTTGQVLFPIVFEYASLAQANAITLYNAILLLLLRLSFQIIGPNFDPSLPALKLPQDISYEPHFPPGFAPNSQAIAIEICKSVEYHLAEERRGAGSFFMIFPLRVAWQTFHPVDQEAVWLQGVMRLIADSTGFEVSRWLTGKEVVPVMD